MGVSGNAPCPCGSGLKYKRCCAAHTSRGDREIAELGDYCNADLRAQLLELEEPACLRARCVRTRRRRVDGRRRGLRAGDAVRRERAAHAGLGLDDGPMEAHVPLVDKSPDRWTATEHELARLNNVVDERFADFWASVGRSETPDERPLAPRRSRTTSSSSSDTWTASGYRPPSPPRAQHSLAWKGAPAPGRSALSLAGGGRSTKDERGHVSLAL